MTYEIKALKGGTGNSSGSGIVSSKKGSRIPKPSKSRKITYPESDGKRMADNTKQFQWIVTIKEGLEVEFLDNPDVFVAGDFLWYPVEGSNKIRVAPDAMVVFGRPKGHRGSYLQWKEDNIPPHAVFEVLSPGNSKKEMKKKFEFYQKYQVNEYYCYDPDNIILNGWIRSGQNLIPIKDMNGWISPRLNIRFEMIEGNELVIYHSNGELFLTFSQQQKRADEESQRANEERQRADEEHQRADEERQLNQVLIQNLLKSGTMDEKQIAQLTQLPVETICQIASAH